MSGSRAQIILQAIFTSVSKSPSPEQMKGFKAQTKILLESMENTEFPIPSQEKDLPGLRREVRRKAVQGGGETLEKEAGRGV